jgi:integrase
VRLKLYRGKWAVVGYDNGRVWRRSLRTADRSVAERRFRDLRFETPGDTIADAVALYLAEKVEAPSHGSMMTAWRALKPTFGHLRPDQIDRKLCKSYARARRNAGVQDGTIIKDLGVLKAALRWTGKAAGAVFEMPPAPPPRDRFITRAECQRLADACSLPHVRLFVILAWATAARHTALLELTWDRVDIEGGIIKLARAGAEGRKGRATVPINAWADAALREAYAARTTEFVIEWGGNAEPLESVGHAFETAARRAKLKGVTPHVLRHSAARAMAEAGVPMWEIAQYLGHTSTKITERTYARFSPTYLRRAAKALE